MHTREGGAGPACPSKSVPTWPSGSYSDRSYTRPNAERRHGGLSRPFLNREREKRRIARSPGVTGAVAGRHVATASR
jgi:hypothetical protein